MIQTDPRSLVTILAPDPCDMGALLRRALAATPHTPATLSRLTGMAPSNVSRALRDPNARPVVVRRILQALGASLYVEAAIRSAIAREAAPAPAEQPAEPASGEPTP